MALFRGIVKGSRGAASRLGSKVSGIVARVDTWELGVVVEGHYDPQRGGVVFSVWQTGGSNNPQKIFHVTDISEFPQDLNL